MKRFDMIQKGEGYPAEMVEFDDGQFALFDEVESRESIAVSAAMMAERESIAHAIRITFQGHFTDKIREACALIALNRTSPAVDVLGIVRRYVKARRAYDAAWLDFDAVNDSDAHSLDPFAEELGAASKALDALVDGSPKAEKMETE